MVLLVARSGLSGRAERSAVLMRTHLATVAVRHNTASVSAKHFSEQCINTLFVQYLLLAHLWKLEPLPYDAVQEVLAKLLNRNHMRFREHARLANIHLSGKRYNAALKHMTLAFLSSPTRLANRILYEFGPDMTALNGEDPNRFATHRDLLWPSQN